VFDDDGPVLWIGDFAGSLIEHGTHRVGGARLCWSWSFGAPKSTRDHVRVPIAVSDAVSTTVFGDWYAGGVLAAAEDGVIRERGHTVAGADGAGAGGNRNSDGEIP
jgi:hypothetical protein